MSIHCGSKLLDMCVCKRDKWVCIVVNRTTTGSSKIRWKPKKKRWNLCIGIRAYHLIIKVELKENLAYKIIYQGVVPSILTNKEWYRKGEDLWLCHSLHNCLQRKKTHHLPPRKLATGWNSFLVRRKKM